MAHIEDFQYRCRKEGAEYMYNPSDDGYYILHPLPSWRAVCFFHRSDILAMGPEDLDRAMLRIRLAVLFEA